MNSISTPTKTSKSRDWECSGLGSSDIFGQSPTYFLSQTVAGVTTDLEAQGNKSFSRIGAYGWWFIKDFDLETFYLHGQDNVYLGTACRPTSRTCCRPAQPGPPGTADSSKRTTPTVRS